MNAVSGRLERVARSRLTTTKMQTSPEVLKQARKVLGQYLRAIREHREMTQVQQADASGLAQADVSEIENGSLNYGIDKLLSYCRGVDCCFFLGSRDGKHLDLDHMIEKMRDPI